MKRPGHATGRKMNLNIGKTGIEAKIRKEIDDRADKILRRIFSTFDMRQVEVLISELNPFFKKSFKKIIVNRNHIEKLKTLFASRKGPIIFCPTHRSYVDFMVLSTILLFYGLEIPLICAGEDFLNMTYVANQLRGCGAFFMRRTFKDDPLYKAIFYEYVAFLNKERQILEFFVEGTRSRTNKIMQPRYGFMSVCSRTYLKKEVDDITFVPVTINYSRVLEGESFPGELRGGKKVPESVGRILTGVYDILMTNLGTMSVDFCEPMSLKDYTAKLMSEKPEFNPFEKKPDAMVLN